MIALLDPRTWAALGLGALLLLAAAFAGLQTVRLSSAKTALATERADRAEEQRRYAAAALAASERARLAEQEHAAREQELTDAYQKDVAARDAALADARADADSLRGEVERYAAGGGAGPQAGAAACGDLGHRARTLGDLFRDADGLAQKLAGAAERHAGEVRALKRQLTIDRSACSPESHGESEGTAK